MEGERNLAPERGPNIWDRDEYSTPASSPSSWRDSLGGVAVAAAGAALAGMGGVMVYRSLRKRMRSAAPARDEDVMSGRDEVDEQSSDSFPASDAPSWTPVRAVQPREQQ